MLSTENSQPLTGESKTTPQRLPEQAPLQMLLIPGQSILMYAGSLRYSVRFPKETWNKILTLLKESDHEISEIKAGVPGAIKFPQPTPKVAEAKA